MTAEDIIVLDEIAALMHVKPRTARDKIVTRADFPKPVWRLSQRNRAWRRRDVLTFLGLAEPQSP